MNLKFWAQPESDMPAVDDPGWERALINKMAVEFLREQRRSRRWGIIFKVGILLYLLLLAGVYFIGGLSDSIGSGGKHTALVELEGAIAPGADASADQLVGGLRKAFEADQSEGVILRINSPGGSPVQSGYAVSYTHL